MPFRVTNGLECVFPIWFTQCGHVWFTLSTPCPCHTLTMPFFSRPWHSTGVKRRPAGYLPAFGFFRLPRGVPQRLISEAYQSSSQWSIPMTVKSVTAVDYKKDDLLNCWTKPRPTFFVNVRPWPHSDMCNWAPFSWCQRTLRVKTWEPSGASVKPQGSHDSIWGTKGQYLRPRCIRTFIRSRTQH